LDANHVLQLVMLGEVREHLVFLFHGVLALDFAGAAGVGVPLVIIFPREADDDQALVGIFLPPLA
jgi:hypothetical protein